MDMLDLLSGLNEEQAQAVAHGDGPLLIIAGAGTGKTKVITNRIASLITDKRARPDEILAVTFTEKAATEMEERVDGLIPYSYSFVTISTFNSFGEQVLRDYGLEIGCAPDFRLLDEVEQAIFFREHLFKMPLRHYRPLSAPTRYIMEIMSAVKRLKQEDISPEKYTAFAQSSLAAAGTEAEEEKAHKHHEMAQVYDAYQKLLRRENKIDFEDQISLAADLFRRRPSVLEFYRKKFRYILVDEFQDTNTVQFELLRLLAAEHGNLTVVGDDDQSIFRFRGASLSNILRFSRIYPDARKIVLTRNYRSTQQILDASHRLIRFNNPDRLEVRENISKTLSAQRKSEGRSILLLQFDTLSHETDHVAGVIADSVESEGLRYAETAILVRRNGDAEPFLQALNIREIPFRFSGSRGLYGQPEIRLLLAFLRSVTDFDDSRSLFYLASSDIYAVPPYDLTVLLNAARKKNVSLHRIFKAVAEGTEMPGISEETLKKVDMVMKGLADSIELAKEKNAGQVLYAFLERSGFLKQLIAREDAESEIRIKNIRIFFDKVKNFSTLTSSDSIYDFAGHLDLLQQVGDNPATAEAELEADAVQVLTVHKAKGLEFPLVFLVNLTADRYPGRPQRDKIPVPDAILKEQLPESASHVEEERRLFYVGMTRARDSLYLTWSKDHGLKRPKKVSPFVLEALDLPVVPSETRRQSVLEELRRYAPGKEGKIPIHRPSKKETLVLSYYRVNDYSTCPLQYNLRHVMKISPPPHHNLVFGRVLHDTIHRYLLERMRGRTVSLEDVLKDYESRWVNEGFLSREHEEMRKKAGQRALELFYAGEEQDGRLPRDMEKKFRWQEGRLAFTGRWDRVDEEPDGAVIIDFKTTEVADQKEADKRTADSLQMDLYALSFEKTEKAPLKEVRLHFLESGIVGRAVKGKREKDRAMDAIRRTEEGIRSDIYDAAPDWHNCGLCAFRTICPFSYAY